MEEDLELVETTDFACWFIPTRVMQAPHTPHGKDSGCDGISASTLWFNSTDASKRFLDAWIEIEEDGTICISCVGDNGHLAAKEIIEGMTSPPEVGKIYQKAKVVSIKDFGAFVEILPGVEGLCHISELSAGYVKSADEICKAGDIIPVKLLQIDDQGRLRLSRKAALLELKQKEDKKEITAEQRT